MGIVIFSTTIPGTIQCLKLEKGSSMICQKDGISLCRRADYGRCCFYKKITCWFVSGEGFVLQKIYGEGRVFLEIAGDSIIHDLKEGEVLYCNSGNVVAFQDSVDFNITLVKKNVYIIIWRRRKFSCKIDRTWKKLFYKTQNQMQKSENL